MTPRILAGSLLLGFATLIPGQPAPTGKLVSKDMPFACFTPAWAGSFKVLSTRYDKAANRVTWNLEAEKAGPVAAYEAYVVDGDGVQVDTIKVKFTPAVAKVKAGAKLRADLPLGFTAGEPARITIRVRR